MQYGIAFTPLVPTIVLWIALAAIVVIGALLLLSRSRGAAVRVFALAHVTARHRQHGLAVRTQRPGTGEIIRRDDDRRDAVAAMRRPRGRLVIVVAR